MAVHSERLAGSAGAPAFRAKEALRPSHALAACPPNERVHDTDTLATRIQAWRS